MTDANDSTLLESDARRPRAVITGGAAPFAGRLVHHLESRGWVVSTVEHADPDLVPARHSLHLPVTASQDLASVVSDADAVLLLSGLDSLTSMVDDSRDLDQILGALTPGACVVEVSTMAVYGDASDDLVTEDDQPTVPAELDPVAACEIRVLAANDWARAIVVRPGLVYAEGGGLALEAAIDLARTHEVSRYVGSGTENIPTVHEDDLLDLLTKVIEHPSGRGIYHAVSATVTARELADAVATAAGVTTVSAWTPETLETELGIHQQPLLVDVRANPDRCRARQDLGWSPSGPALAQALRT